MGLRFRKSIKIAPGIRLNVGKKTSSFTIDKRGASYNIGSRGMYSNFGVKGTGLSYRSKITGFSHPVKRKSGCLGLMVKLVLSAVVLLMLLIFVIQRG